MSVKRFNHEIEHGKWIAESNPEAIWGWGTPAGRLRAKMRSQIIVQGAQIGDGSRVLEIGCGTGMFTEMFARTGAYITALDISLDLLDVAKKREIPSGRVEFLEGRFENFSADAPFDAVIGSSVLHHMEIDDALRRIFVLLKPRCFMSFAEPNILNPQVFLERKLRFLFSHVSLDETAFRRTVLKQKLEDCGFENVFIKPFDWLHPWTPKVLIPAMSRLGERLEQILGLREFSGSLYIRARRPLSYEVTRA